MAQYIEPDILETTTQNQLIDSSQLEEAIHPSEQVITTEVSGANKNSDIEIMNAFMELSLTSTNNNKDNTTVISTDGSDFLKYIERNISEDDSFNKISIDILCKLNLTQETFLSNLPTFFKCKSTFLCKEFASIGAKEAAREYIEWSKNQKKNLKIINTELLPGIFPDGIEAKLVDFRVAIVHRCEDFIYEKFPEMRKKVARGNCIITFENAELNDCCVVRGLNKFSGGYWDEDDAQLGGHKAWSKYFLKSPSQAKLMVITEKADGDAAHISVRFYGNLFIIFAGSKNIHIAFPYNKSEYIETYTDARYTVAQAIATCFWKSMHSMEESRRLRLLAFMAHTGYTAMFEYLGVNPQHIVHIVDLKEPLLKFIAWIPCDLIYNTSLCSIPPHYGLELAQYLGLDTIHYSVVGMDQLVEELTRVRVQMQTEGSVVYFMGANGEVIGLLKYKSIWYILLNCVRNQITYQINSINKGKIKYEEAITDGVEDLNNRLEKAKPNMKIEDNSFEEWKNLLTGFYLWCMDKNKKKGGKGTLDLYRGYLNTWKTYLKENLREETPIKIKHNSI